MSKDVLLGRIVYNLDNANEYLYRINYDKLTNPKWHDVISKRNQKCGQLLFSVCVLPEVNIEQGGHIISIEQKTKDFELNLTILGLRDLKSQGILPVTKP